MLTEFRDQLDASAALLLEQFQVPGLGIALRVGDQEAAWGYGVTNLEHPLPITGDTIFQVGSISKTMVGLVAAELEAAGQLDLDAPVAPRLTAFGRLDERITMRHLITHRSGIDAQYMIGEAHRILANHASDEIHDSIQHFEHDSLMFAPGTDYSYSGPGFMVAAAVIEDVTGQRWVDVLRERVFTPAQMSMSFTTADEAITHRVAAPHDISSGAMRIARDEGWQRHWQLPGWDVPGGGVLSTGNDLLRYARFAAQKDAQLGTFTRLADRGVPGHDIAYSWMLEHRRGHRAVLHDGLTIGYATRLMLLPEQDVTIALLTNSVKGEPLKNAVEEMLLDQLFGVRPSRQLEPFDAEKYPGLPGRYDCGFYGQVDLRLRGDGTGFELISLPKARKDGTFTIDPMSAAFLVPIGPGLLSSDPNSGSPEDVIAYTPEPDGSVSALRISDRIARRVS